MSSQTPTPFKRHSTANKILNALPHDVMARLQPNLEKSSLSLGQVLYRVDDKTDFVYFPDNSMVSVIANTAEGQSAEVGVVGREGIVGLNVFLGVDSTPNELLVQISDGSTRIGVKAARREFVRGGELQKLILRFTHDFMTQISQTALCNRLHTIEERLSRWLLMCRDRSETNDLPLTQEFLSIMLGANRPSITIAAINLQSAGLIKYSRGHIKILNREELEDSSCTCYRKVVEESDRK
ncbi:MAG: Crp/Fnr family transcriptional regulator [Acidobacteria bacterium]|nr:Crp/Fnr family transcriptional regulator [Acidobacteriota bacterium]